MIFMTVVIRRSMNKFMSLDDRRLLSVVVIVMFSKKRY